MYFHIIDNQASLDSVSFLISLNYDFLVKILEWLPVGFTRVIYLEYFFVITTSPDYTAI